MRSPPEIWGAFFVLTGPFICDYIGLCQLQEELWIKKYRKRLLPPLVSLKTRESDGVPYDMHLMLDQSLEDKKWEYEVLVYPVKQDENGEWTRGVVNDPEHCDILLFKHTFPDRGEWQCLNIK
jgi:hypothetical protein